MMRMNSHRKLSNQKGYLLMVALILILVVGFMGVTVASMFYASSRSTILHVQADQALYLAESGLEHTIHKIANPIVADRQACGAFNGTYSLGAGQYQITGSLSNSICTLTIVGAVPSIASPLAKRTLSIQLNTLQPTQYAWTGGVSDGASNIAVAQYNSNTGFAWQEFTPAFGGSNQQVTGIGAITGTDVWMVGGAISSSTAPTAYHWDGSTWTALASSSFPNKDTHYNAISCTATNACIAVGDKQDGGGSNTDACVTSYNGSTWTHLNTQNTHKDGSLYAISCFSNAADSCWAVGEQGPRGYFYVGANNGSNTQWTAVRLDSTLTAYPYKGVACTSDTDCWAAGNGATFARKTGAGILATTWSEVATGLPAVQYYGLYCNSSSDCWVVGDTGNIGRWNGSAWSSVATVPATTTNLRSVKCANTNDCWIVSVNNTYYHWNGTSWTPVNTTTNPNPVSNVEFDAIGLIPTVSTLGYQILSWQETF